MRKALSSFLIQLLVCAAFAQNERVVLPLRGLVASEETAVLAIPLAHIEPFLAWSSIWTNDAAGIWVRFSADQRHWTEWSFTGPEAHAAELPGKIVGQLRFEEAVMRFFQVRSDMDIELVEFHFFSPGASPVYEPGIAEESLACPCPLPPYQRRLDWCSSGACPPNPTPSFTTVTHLIVHHSASSNTASDWAAVVRSFWDFHVNTNGWADIGYNWLIDPNGVLYEGRGDNVLGAHFCGANGGTMGVCVIGNFTSATPTQAALDQLRNLLAWKACNIGADPLGAAFHPSSGLTLPRISGHRDGCNTECPGNAFYPMLPTVRQTVVNYIAEACSVSGAGESASTTLQELRIFPNPAQDWLTVESPDVKEAWVHILDAKGRPVVPARRLAGNGLLQIPVAALAPGAYQISLQQHIDGRERRAFFLKQ